MITVLKDQHVDLPSYAELCELKICWNSDNNGRAGGEQTRVNDFLKQCLEIARKEAEP